jgi:hypothetical protein
VTNIGRNWNIFRKVFVGKMREIKLSNWKSFCGNQKVEKYFVNKQSGVDKNVGALQGSTPSTTN